MKENKAQAPKMICKSTIKQQYGWTDTMIAQLLPEPVKKTNPRYKSATQMLLWPEDIVMEAMKTETFATMMQKANKQRQAAYKGAKIREERIRQEKDAFVDSLIGKIYVGCGNLDDLRHRAIEEQQEHYQDKDEYIHNAYDCTAQRVIDRWTVNFIRHSWSNYEELLQEYCDAFSSRDTDNFAEIKEAVLTEIAEKYPELSEACSEQVQRCIHIEALRDMGR